MELAVAETLWKQHVIKNTPLERISFDLLHLGQKTQQKERSGSQGKQCHFCFVVWFAGIPSINFTLDIELKVNRY